MHENEREEIEEEDPDQALFDVWERQKMAKRLDYLLDAKLDGQHLTQDESTELHALIREVGAHWLSASLARRDGAGFGAKYEGGDWCRSRRRDIPRDLQEAFAFGTSWQRQVERDWRDFLYEHGDTRYQGFQALQRMLELERQSARHIIEYFDVDEPENVENVRVFLRWYGRELILLAASMPGEDGERFKRAAAVVWKDQRAHEQRSQNENRAARPDQDRFSYQDVAYLAGCSVRQAKRVLTEMYGLQRKGVRRWFTREQVTAAFPYVRLEP